MSRFFERIKIDFMVPASRETKVAIGMLLVILFVFPVSSTAQDNETFHQRQFESLIVNSGIYGSVPAFAVDSVCKITNGTHPIASGFFAEFKLHGMNIHGLFTNNHVLNATYMRAKDIFITVAKGKKTKDFRFHRSDARFIFTNKSLDVTFVRLLLQEVIDVNKFEAAFLQVDGDKNKLKKGMTLGIPQYPNGTVRRVATGVLKKVTGHDIIHLVNTLPGSSGSPLIDEHGNAVGIHKAGGDGFNVAVCIADVLLALERGSELRDRDADHHVNATGMLICLLCFIIDNYLDYRRNPGAPRGNAEIKAFLARNRQGFGDITISEQQALRLRLQSLRRV